MPLVIIIVLIVVLHIRINYLNNKKNTARDNERYLLEDFRANYTRVKPLDENMFITLAEKDLPFRYDYDKTVKIENSIITAQNKVKKCFEAPIIKTDLPTNIDVKKRFGAANLQTVIDGEENHTNLIRRLNSWAKLLIETGNKKDAEDILEKAVAARSDISETYVLLYTLYAGEGSSVKIDKLYEKASLLPEFTKKRFLGSIDKENKDTEHI